VYCTLARARWLQIREAQLRTLRDVILGEDLGSEMAAKGSSVPDVFLRRVSGSAVKVAAVACITVSSCWLFFEEVHELNRTGSNARSLG
jgi:hypothetical protein